MYTTKKIHSIFFFRQFFNKFILYPIVSSKKCIFFSFKQDISGPLDDVQSESSNQSLGSNSQGPGPTSSQGPQPGVSPLRPTPSPSGSSGSRSMSPAVGECFEGFFFDLDIISNNRLLLQIRLSCPYPFDVHEKKWFNGMIGYVRSDVLVAAYFSLL